MSDKDRRDALLLKILAQIPFEGWTVRALAAADPEQAETKVLFPRGIADAVDHFADWADRQGEARLAGMELDAFRIRDLIALMVRARLEALEPHREAVRREAAWLALHEPLMTPRLVWRTADRMWRKAGDTATDFNHYSKRALLSGVIASTTVCWLGDASEDKADSWAFLDRRIDDVMRFGKLTGKAKKLADPSAFLEGLAGLAGRVRYRG